MSIDATVSTETIERKANVVRSRFLRAVDALDARRHQVERIAEKTKALAAPAVIGAAVVAVLFGASAVAFSTAVRRRRPVSAGARLAKVMQDFDTARRPSFTLRVGQKIVLSLIGLAATEVARRAVKNIVDGRLLDGRLAVGRALEAHSSEIKVS